MISLLLITLVQAPQANTRALREYAVDAGHSIVEFSVGFGQDFLVRALLAANRRSDALTLAKALPDFFPR